jgi:hypothetical protein
MQDVLPSLHQVECNLEKWMSEQAFINISLQRYALERYRRFGPMTLHQLEAASDLFCTFPQSFLDFLHQHQKSILDALYSEIDTHGL